MGIEMAVLATGGSTEWLAAAPLAIAMGVGVRSICPVLARQYEVFYVCLWDCLARPCVGSLTHLMPSDSRVGVRSAEQIIAALKYGGAVSCTNRASSNWTSDEKSLES